MLRRAQLRLFLRYASKKHPDAAKVLNNPEMFEHLYESVAQEASGHPLMDFLQFLLDNQQNILALIAGILKLFPG